MFSFKRTCFFLLLLIIPLFLSAAAEDDSCCRTRYPILLVHGISFSTNTPILNYWDTLPDMLREKGALVYLSKHPVFASHDENGEFLKKRIYEILKETGADKVNIIAHSKGGLESRYLISRCGMSGQVASLTTLCSPHHGTYIADDLFAKMDGSMEMTIQIAGAAVLLGALTGDFSSNPYAAGIQLSRNYMEEFNKEVPDAQGVYYQSYAASIDPAEVAPPWRFLYKRLEKMEGPNDGLVSVTSAQWGNYRGLITVKGRSSFTHGDVVCLNPTGITKGEEMIEFYRKLVHDLKKRGY